MSAFSTLTSAATVRAGRWVFVVLALFGGSIAVRAAQAAAPPDLSGLWRLHQATGDLPGQAERALDGEASAGDAAAIRLDQTGADLTVRRQGQAQELLRVIPLSGGPVEHRVPGGGVLSGRAEWRGGALVVTGQVAVKQGFLKRKVPFEEVWQLDEGARTLTVTATLKTPVGVKRRTQVFVRVAEGVSGGRPGGAPMVH